MGPEYQGTEHRHCRRRLARPDTSVSCHAGASDLGPDLARALVDASEAGLGLLLKAPLEPGAEVYVVLRPPGAGGPLKCAAKVIWCAPAPGGHRVGVELRRWLDQAELFRIT